MEQARTVSAREMCESLNIDPDEEITRFTMEDAALVLLRDTEHSELVIKNLLMIADASKLASALLEASHWSDIFIDVLETSP